MRRLAAFLLCATMLFGMLGVASAAPTKTNIKVTVNGKTVVFPESPVLLDGRLLVPFRAFGEATGSKVSFNAATKIVNAVKGQNKIVLPLGGTKATVNGKSVALDVAPLVISGTTLVPLRFLSENFGSHVVYDAKRGTVTVTSQTAVSKTYTVEITDFAFTPSKLTIKAGDKVTFVNRDTVGHTATADDGTFKSKLLDKDASFTFTFKDKGTYAYHCEPHPFMKGTITVE